MVFPLAGWVLWPCCRFSAAPPKPASGELWLTVLDVGQGLAVVARTENHALLYDTGPGFGAEADSGNRTIVPFLRGEGVKHLDAMVVTHADSDHSGGALSVLQAVPVEWLVSSLNDDHPIQLAAAKAQHAEPANPGNGMGYGSTCSIRRSRATVIPGLKPTR